MLFLIPHIVLLEEIRRKKSSLEFREHWKITKKRIIKHPKEITHVWPGLFFSHAALFMIC